MIDIDGDGYNMTSAANGVNFDFAGTGQSIRVSWTASGSDDSWLVLDRNGNGKIDSAMEMFGNVTSQPPSLEANGFIALAEFDKPERGGNLDGEISASDTVFSKVRVWRDRNHNGVSEPDELVTLASVGIESLDLDYRQSRFEDLFGNRFRYRAKVDDRPGHHVARWAYDVFLVMQ